MLGLAEQVSSGQLHTSSNEQKLFEHTSLHEAQRPPHNSSGNIKTRLHVDLSPSPGNLSRLGSDGKGARFNLKAQWNTVRRPISAPRDQEVLNGSRKLKINVEDLEKRQNWLSFDDAPGSMEGRSWDEIDNKIHGSSMIDTRTLPRSLDYDSKFKPMLLAGAANAALGFSSDLLTWDDRHSRFELNPAISEASFAGILSKFAVTGTLLRRLSISVLDIRAHAKHSESRTALALASAIEEFVISFQTNGHQLHEAKNLIELSLKCDARADQVYILAELIGCAGSKGRLSRLPSTVSLLQRVYLRSEALDSNVLWEIASSCLVPWLEQLNYVTGLSDPLLKRSFQATLKDSRFPEIFLDVDENLNTVTVNASDVPGFLNPITANAACQCFQLLCILGFKGPDAIKRSGQTVLQPISISHKPGSLHGLSDMRPQDIADNIRAQDLSEVSRREAVPGSIHLEMRKVMSLVTSRSEELDLEVKHEYFHELKEIERIIVGLYLLKDGVLWSQLSDHVSNLFRSKHNFNHNLSLVNMAMSSFHYDARYTAKQEMRTLKIHCRTPFAEMLLGSSFLTRCQEVFNRIIHLHLSHKTTELALLGVEIDLVAKKISSAIESPAAGMQAVQKSFSLIHSLHLES